MQLRLNSIEVGKFFFQPGQLHLQAADLFVQVGDQRLLVFGLPATIVRKQIAGAFQQPPFPVSDLRRMHAELGCQFARGPVSANRRQGRFRLHRRLDPPSFYSHSTPPPFGP
jgi:hypothetical protein